MGLSKEDWDELDEDVGSIFICCIGPNIVCTVCICIVVYSGVGVYCMCRVGGRW